MATFIRGNAIPGAKAYRLYKLDAAGAETPIFKKEVQRPFSFIGTVDSDGKPAPGYTLITAADTSPLKGKYPIMQTNHNGQCYYKFTGTMTVTFEMYGGGTVTDYEDFEAYLYTNNYDSIDIKFNGFEVAWNDSSAFDYQKLYIKINDERILFRTLTSQDLPIKSIALNGSLTVHHADDEFKHTEFIPVANLSNVYENGNGQLIEKPFCVTGFANTENTDIVAAFYNDASFTTATKAEVTKSQLESNGYNVDTIKGYAGSAEYVVFFARGLEQQAYANAGGIDFCLDDYHNGELKDNGTYRLAVRALAETDTRFEDSVLSEPVNYTKS